MDILCATCSRISPSLDSYSCHKCGYMTCEACLQEAKQCPKCLMGNIDIYSDGSASFRRKYDG